MPSDLSKLFTSERTFIVFSKDRQQHVSKLKTAGRLKESVSQELSFGMLRIGFSLINCCACALAL